MSSHLWTHCEVPGDREGPGGPADATPSGRKPEEDSSAHGHGLVPPDTLPVAAHTCGQRTGFPCLRNAAWRPGSEPLFVSERVRRAGRTVLGFLAVSCLAPGQPPRGSSCLVPSLEPDGCPRSARHPPSRGRRPALWLRPCSTSRARFPRSWFLRGSGLFRCHSGRVSSFLCMVSPVVLAPLQLLVRVPPRTQHIREERPCAPC